MESGVYLVLLKELTEIHLKNSVDTGLLSKPMSCLVWIIHSLTLNNFFYSDQPTFPPAQLLPVLSLTTARNTVLQGKRKSESKLL